MFEKLIGFYHNIFKTPWLLALLTMVILFFLGLTLNHELVVFSVTGIIVALKNRENFNTVFCLKFAGTFLVLHLLLNVGAVTFELLKTPSTLPWIIFGIPKVLIYMLVGFISAFLCIFVFGFLTKLLINLLNKNTITKKTLYYITLPIEKPKVLALLFTVLFILYFICGIFMLSQGRFVKAGKSKFYVGDKVVAAAFGEDKVFILKRPGSTEIMRYEVFNSDKRGIIQTKNIDFSILSTESEVVGLDNNKVLILGPKSDVPRSNLAGVGGTMIVPILFDFSNNSFKELNVLNVSVDFGYSVKKLKNGKVLIAGGAGANDQLILFDPKDNTFKFLDKLNAGKRKPVLVELQDNRVLIVGHEKELPLHIEIFDPKTEKVTLAGKITKGARSVYGIYLLKNGNIAILQNTMGPIGDSDKTLYIYTPKMQLAKERPFKLPAKLSSVNIVQMQNKNLLITGGQVKSGQLSKAAYEYDFEKGKFVRLLQGIRTKRKGHEAILLGNGNILILGGFGGGWNIESMEMFVPNFLTRKKDNKGTVN